MLFITNISDSEWAIIAQFAAENPDEKIPENLLNYLKDNKYDIISDIKNDALSNFIDQLGLGITRFGGLLTVFEGLKGPNVANTFVVVNQNGLGSSVLKYGKNISTAGKALGYGFIAVGFGIGMYDDMINRGKTVGQAVTHNVTSTSVGIGAGALGTTEVGLLLTNPGGWAILGGIAVGTVWTYVSDAPNPTDESAESKKLSRRTTIQVFKEVLEITSEKRLAFRKSKTGLAPHPSFRAHLTESEVVDHLLSYSPELKQGYEVYQDFLATIRTKDCQWF